MDPFHEYHGDSSCRLTASPTGASGAQTSGTGKDHADKAKAAKEDAKDHAETAADRAKDSVKVGPKIVVQTSAAAQRATKLHALITRSCFFTTTTSEHLLKQFLLASEKGSKPYDPFFHFGESKPKHNR